MESDVRAEDINLYLPSGLPDHLDHLTPAVLKDKEARIRLAILDTIFRDLLKLLRVKMGILNGKRDNRKAVFRGQVGNTRAQTLLSNFSIRIDDTADRYRKVRAALLKVDPKGSWTGRLRFLNKEDVRTPQEEYDPDDKKNKEKEKEKQKTRNSALQLGEGSRTTDVSWIWKVSSHSTSGTEADGGNGEKELGEGSFSKAHDIE
jgi:hypothetical protein